MGHAALRDVFISYSSQDKAVADALCAVLESHGIRCWIAPRDMLPGIEWGAGIIDAIGGSRVMVLVYSANSNKSRQVVRELERAVAKGVVILPFRIEDVAPSKSMEYFISTHHWFDALTPPLEQHLQRLAENLSDLLARNGGRGPVPPVRTAATDSPARSSSGSVVRAPASPASEVLGLEPGLDYLIELLPDQRVRPWPLTRPFYSIGRERAKISLADPRVSRRHVVLAQVGPDWVAIHDRRASKPMAVSGWQVVQKTLRRGDAIRIGKTWLVFVPRASPDTPPPLKPLPGRLLAASEKSIGVPKPGRDVAVGGTLEDEDDEEPGATAYLRLSTGPHELAASVGQPLLIGSHPACAVALAGQGLAPFHCLLTWMLDGVCVLALGGHVQVNDRPVEKAVVSGGENLKLGGVALTVRIDGDPQAVAVRRRQALARTPKSVALTAIYGPHRDETSLLPASRPLIVGRSCDTDLAFPRSRDMADGQLEITLDGGSLRDRKTRAAVALQNLCPHVQTLVNGQLIDGPATASPGDVIQFAVGGERSPTALLLHYALASDSWPGES
jgi:pSer/pThr/pTyr-binding forkhead associated (FHA) protein